MSHYTIKLSYTIRKCILRKRITITYHIFAYWPIKINLYDNAYRQHYSKNWQHFLSSVPKCISFNFIPNQFNSARWDYTRLRDLISNLTTLGCLIVFYFYQYTCRERYLVFVLSKPLHFDVLLNYRVSPNCAPLCWNTIITSRHRDSKHFSCVILTW